MKRFPLLICLALGACHPSISGPFYAIDGDTLAKGHERYRLLEIDAPEMPGHCRPGRHCVEGDPWMAQARLQQLIDQPGAACVGSKRDYYGRLLVHCTANGRDVGQQLLAEGYVSLYRRS